MSKIVWQMQLFRQTTLHGKFTLALCVLLLELTFRKVVLGSTFIVLCYVLTTVVIIKLYASET